MHNIFFELIHNRNRLRKCMSEMLTLSFFDGKF